MATQLIVDGKPFLALSGELNNTISSNLEYMKGVWPMLAKRVHLNTVLTGVAWNWIEPEEGKYDFSIADAAIETPGRTTCASRGCGSRVGRTGFRASPRLGEGQPGAVPARPDRRRQIRGSAFDPR